MQPEDWGGFGKGEESLQSMPERHVVLKPVGIRYNAEEMARIRRGFFPAVMEEKWFLYFSGNRLRMHRSWTRLLIYDVGFAFTQDGSASISDVIVNRDPDQYLQDKDEEDLEEIQAIIRIHPLDALDEPKQDGLVLAAKQAMQPNYLGSPDVVGKLVHSVFDLIARDFFADTAWHNRSHDAPEFRSVNREADRTTLIHGIVWALAGMDDNYVILPAWHLPEELRWNIMQYLASGINFTDYECLYELVLEDIKQVIDKTYELQVAYDLDRSLRWGEDVMPELQRLDQFVTAIFLGTSTALYGEKTLSEFRWLKPSET